MKSTLTNRPLESRRFQKVKEILDSFGNDPVRLIAILRSVQNEYRYLPEPVLSYIAISLNIPRARVFGVATFYDHFSPRSEETCGRQEAVTTLTTLFFLQY